MGSEAEAKSVEALTTTVKSTLTVVFSSNIVLTVFTSAVLFYLWGMINGLQLIAMTCLFKIRLPTNVQTAFIQIMKLAAFDFLQTESLYMKIFKFSPTTPFSPSFDEAAYSGSNFILGIGSMFLMMLGYAMFLLIRWIILY